MAAVERAVRALAGRPQLLLLAAVIAAGAATRAYLLPFPGSADLAFIKMFSERLAAVRLRDFYLADYDHYLPAYLYVLWATAELKNAFFPHVTDSTYYILLKIPPNLFDIGTALIIYKIVEKKVPSHWALLAPALYLFNPGTLYNTAVWGQFDAVIAFFALAAFYFLLERKPELATVLMVIAFMVKAQAIALFPVFGFALLIRTPPKRIAISAALALVVVFLIALPFFWDRPTFGMVEEIRKMLDNYQITSLNAWNLWEIIGGWPQADSAPILGISRQMWGFALWLSAQIILGFWMIRRRADDWSVYWAGSLALFAFFILPTRIHERYLFPFFAFFLTAAVLSRYRLPLTLIYAAISVLHFFNLYAVEQPEPYPILTPLFEFAIPRSLEIAYLLVGSFVLLMAASFQRPLSRLAIEIEASSRLLWAKLRPVQRA